MLLLACSHSGSSLHSSEPSSSVVLDLTLEAHPDYGSLVYARWRQGAAAEVEILYTFDGESLSRVVSGTEGSNEALLLGIPYATDVTVTLAVEGEVSPAATLTTAPLPTLLPAPVSVEGDPEAWDPSLRYVWMSISERPEEGDYGLERPWWTLIVDRAGRIVWARPTPDDAASLHPRVSWDGRTLLLDESTAWGSLDAGEGSRVLRMYVDGTVVETIPVPGMHHPFTDTPDGAILWNARDGIDELIVEREPDGATRTIWACAEALEAGGGRGRCGSNTLTYVEATDRLLFSSYTHGTVFEVERSTGTTVRSFGTLGGSYAIDPATSAFWWQHGVHYTPDGNLLVSVHGSEDGEETVVREYEVDDPANTLRETWNFGVGDGVWGMYMGEPHLLPGGNILHNTGSEPRLREATREGVVVWDLQFGVSDEPLGDAWMGRSTPISDLYALLP